MTKHSEHIQETYSSERVETVKALEESAKSIIHILRSAENRGTYFGAYRPKKTFCVKSYTSAATTAPVTIAHVKGLDVADCMQQLLAARAADKELFLLCKDALRESLGHFALFNSNEDESTWPKYVKTCEQTLTKIQ